MPISGVVIRCQPGRAPELATTLNNVAGVDIHRIVDESTMVAVIEAESVAGEVDLTRDMMAVDGVVSVHLAYHNFEDL